MDQNPESPAPAPAPPARRLIPRRGLLRGMRVRKKVLFLHTLFSLGLAAILLVPLRPAITEVVEQAEVNEARVILRLAMAAERAGDSGTSARLEALSQEVQIRSGSAEEIGLS